MTAEGGQRRFEGRVAIVTGSTADPSIGRSCATRLAREGASVVINGRSADQLAAAERQLAAEGYPVAAVQGDLEDDVTVPALVTTALDRFGRLDLVVNTVGGAPYAGPLDQLDRQGLLGTVSLNTWPTVSLIHEAMARGLADGDGGAVVNISSGSPNKTTASMAAYAAAKAALNALTRTIAADAGRRGVRVNAVSPGLTKSSGTRGIWEADGGQGAGSHLLLGRLTEADDIAAAVLFLLSDDAKAITGVLIDVDGGNHLQSGGWSPFAGGAS
jgi:NAD(P)-dependent dehydrogenase (short-subunit alcohol dehydrogenase family)